MAKKIARNLVLDTESITPNTQYFAEHMDTKINGWYMENIDDEEDNFKGITMEELLESFKHQESSLNIYCHNLSWDFNFIWKHIQGKMKRWNEVPAKNVGYSMFKQGNKVYKATIRLYNKNRKLITINFLCSQKLLTASVGAMGSQYGITKHLEDDGEDFYNHEPFESWETMDKRFQEYLINDVKIVIRALRDFRDAIASLGHKGIDWQSKLTAGSLGLALQKRKAKEYFLDKPIKSKRLFNTSKESYDLGKKFYFGGFTQVHPGVLDLANEGDWVKDIEGVSYDINSAHPASMTKPMPISEMIHSKEWENPENLPHLVWYEIKIGKAMSKKGNLINLMNWSKHQKELRYTTKQSNFTAFYGKEEWEEMNKWYDFSGVKIVNTWYTFSAPFLKDYIEELYALRQEAKRLGQSGTSETYKIILNGSYGKHGQKPAFVSGYVCENKEEADELFAQVGKVVTLRNGKVVKIMGLSPDSNVTKGEYIINVEPEATKFSNIILAAAVTMYTRLNVYNAIRETGEENFLYADTDSVYSSKREKTPYLHNLELGAWKKEKEFTFFASRGSKTKMTEDDSGEIEITYSGINGKYADKEMTNFEKFLSREKLVNANKSSTQTPSGLVLFDSDYLPRQRFL